MLRGGNSNSSNRRFCARSTPWGRKRIAPRSRITRSSSKQPSNGSGSNWRMLNKKAPGKLVVLSAPSGAGKSTLAAMLLERHPGFQLSISHTTRAPRGDEKNGVHYYFVSAGEFKQMIADGDFLEYALVFGKHYY